MGCAGADIVAALLACRDIAGRSRAAQAGIVLAIREIGRAAARPTAAVHARAASRAAHTVAVSPARRTGADAVHALHAWGAGWPRATSADPTRAGVTTEGGAIVPAGAAVLGIGLEGAWREAPAAPAILR